MNRIRSAAIAAMVAVGMLAAIPANAAAPVYHEYVALGDSWTADVFTTFPPTTQFTPLDCAQSVTDYPHEVAGALGISNFRDASCGSATTVSLTQPQTAALGGVNPPQFDRLTPTTDLVTLGMGGNDIGLAGDIEGCLNLLPNLGLGTPAPLGGYCKDKLAPKGGVDSVAVAITATAPKIATALAQIHQRSPHARILLVNYLAGLPANGKGCWPIVPVLDPDVAYLQAKFLQMNAMLAAVATASHVQLVDTYTPTLGHDVCEAPTVADVAGLIPLSVSNPLLLAFPFHPNGAGAAAQSEIVLDAVHHLP
ncbi:MAG: Lysophospholipase [Amycolatopsis sp.]|uniref:SGNH/GDSL hydrolase family protein n=1 Tax=Amycolatopsis sp. TaxID=37632 RepID=UPI002602BF1B|nr:SGNH/GDSL hydrolase family protein [Amycolatopsis sp.]MCU1681988.1 Lysophospholipase [Amycolatopsis sp.]